MHELSIALSIIDAAEELTQRDGIRQVNAIHLKLGPLSGVVKEALLSAYGLACEGTALQASKLVIEETPVVVFCQSCQKEQTLESIQLFSCPACNIGTPKVMQGKELEIVAMEVER